MKEAKQTGLIWRNKAVDLDLQRSTDFSAENEIISSGKQNGKPGASCNGRLSTRERRMVSHGH